MKNRIVLLFSCFLALWAALLLRAARIQLMPDTRLAALKRRQFETALEIHSRRGAILDRNGMELAASIPAYSLFVDPKLVDNPAFLARRLGKALGVPAKTIRGHLREKSKRFVWIKRQLGEKERDEIKKWRMAGIGFVEEPKRVYPNGGLLAQVLGFVGAEGIGLEGIELQFNPALEGRMKTVVLPRDARGRPLLEDGRALTDALDGEDVQLTIDREVQFALERELQSVVSRFAADAAVGVVMDAQSSELLGLATTLPENGEGSGRTPDLARNRAVVDAFEPGSTMKTFVVAAALKAGVIRPGTRYDCEGGRMKVGDKWISEADSHHAFRQLTVTEILANSSNIGVAKIAFDLGAEPLHGALRDFGFGAKTGVALPGESRGLLSSPPWRPHLLSNIAFGQGVAVTALQMAVAYTAIANGGIVKPPILVRGVGGLPWSTAAEGRRVLSTHEAATLKLMLSAATEERATGANARIPNYPVAGKTGTAQKVDPVRGGYMKEAYISSFAGFVPSQEPRFVIFVAVDNPKKAYYGSQVAAPVFSRLAQYLVRHAGLPPVLISERDVISGSAAGDHRRVAAQKRALSELKASVAADASGPGFPNLLGLTLREALDRLGSRDGEIRVRGHGVVVRTVPSAGADGGRRRLITLILENPD